MKDNPFTRYLRQAMDLIQYLATYDAQSSRWRYLLDLLSRAETLARNPRLRGEGLSASNRRAIKRLVAKRGKR